MSHRGHRALRDSRPQLERPHRVPTGRGPMSEYATQSHPLMGDNISPGERPGADRLSKSSSADASPEGESQISEFRFYPIDSKRELHCVRFTDSSGFVQQTILEFALGIKCASA